jgi:hypothetical protein
MPTMRSGGYDGANGRRRSGEWMDRRDLDGFLHRSWLKSTGVSDETFRGRPMDVEESIRSYPLDGVVLLTGCDKTNPASIMGALQRSLHDDGHCLDDGLRDRGARLDATGRGGDSRLPRPCVVDRSPTACWSARTRPGRSARAAACTRWRMRAIW